MRGIKAVIDPVYPPVFPTDDMDSYREGDGEDYTWPDAPTSREYHGEE